MSRIKVIFIVCILVVFNFSILFAQEPQFRREVDTIPVIVNRISVANPYAGGYDYSKPAFADIDNDGDFDLFIGDYYGRLVFYRNVGTPAIPNFHFDISESFSSIDVGRYCAPVFVDMDDDGDLDLFLGEVEGYVRFYRNTGTAQIPSFTPEQLESISSIDFGSYSIPTFVDIDNDNDFDLFVGVFKLNQNPRGYLYFYRNTGTVSNPSFTPDEIESLASVDFIHNCAPSFADIDHDGDFDLLMGDYYGKLAFYRNTGDATTPAFTLDQIKSLELIDVGVRSVPVFVDIDSDSDYDLFVGEWDETPIFYRNTGTATDPNFSPDDIESLIVIDVGWSSTPTFADIDDDGDADLFIGEGKGTLNFYRNTGTATNPTLTFETEAIDGVGVDYDSSPAFGDIDHDGDYDLFVGGSEFGWINIYRNTGTPAEPAFTHETDSLYVGWYSYPALVDVDDDGDLDLFSGTKEGNIYFFRNTGAATSPVFSLETENFASINVGGRSRPTFVDIDNDGDFDLFVGNGFDLRFYRNTGTSTNPTYTADDIASLKSMKVGGSSAPTFVDIDNDGDFDLFVGEGAGGLFFYRNGAHGEKSGFRIHSITDVKPDQGKQVRIIWNKVLYDGDSDKYKITHYALWRRGDHLSTSSVTAVINVSSFSEMLETGASANIPARYFVEQGKLSKNEVWDFIASIPAHHADQYTHVSPTLADSSAAGIPWSMFFVSAHTPNPDIFFNTQPDSGYSVDNLAPATPQNVSVAGRYETAGRKVMVSWQSVPDEDLAHYAIYRHTETGFDPATVDAYATTTDTLLVDSDVDSDLAYYYKISAFDVSGNESDYSEESSIVVKVEEAATLPIPKEFGLSQNYPNPFNPTTIISYQLPQDSYMSLKIYNTLGQEVRTLVDGEIPAGYYTIHWDGKNNWDKQVVSGIYLYRLAAGSFGCVKKMTVLR